MGLRGRGCELSTHQTLTRIALSLAGAVESSHFGKRDFRVGKKIFATLPEPERAVVKLTVEQQEMLVGAEPAIFEALPGGWGRKGWTSIRLHEADEKTLTSALRTAWRNVAPKRLLDKA